MPHVEAIFQHLLVLNEKMGQLSEGVQRIEIRQREHIDYTGKQFGEIHGQIESLKRDLDAHEFEGRRRSAQLDKLMPAYQAAETRKRAWCLLAGVFNNTFTKISLVLGAIGTAVAILAGWEKTWDAIVKLFT